MRPKVVTQLSSALKRSKPTIAKRRTRELQKSLTEAVVISVISSMLESKRPMYSAKQIQGLVKEHHDCKVSLYVILKVLKEKFRFSYRKIKRVPFSGNSERNKVLRHLYARKMLEVYQSGPRIINVDESWVPAADFHQRRWKRRGMLNTAPDKTLTQKVNIITAMSSDGKIWASLTTCNTDSDVLMLFMT